MTINDHVIRYQEHATEKTYEELVAAFEAAVADAESGEFARAFEAAKHDANSRESWEAACRELFGPSGFMHVFSIDHTEMLRWYGVPVKAKMWIYGSPILAATMLVHDIRVGGRVPLQILIYEADNGEARIGYDLPSTIMGRFGNADVNAAALELDTKLVAFATELTDSGV
ncbi:MAG TPA: DUF302 domain-containing protein [Pseudonocardiaceae bacterium]|jgi:uncharacterized protein (DUF302 family)|nr:DUF302 domain-containing protein [Pseudonocardiaceae bacterium]